MRQKINLITLGVANIQKALNFYEKGLGWKKSSASADDLVLFPLGGIILALYPRKLLAEDANVSEKGSGFSGLKPGPAQPNASIYRHSLCAALILL